MKRSGASATLRFTGRNGEMPIGKSTEPLAHQLADSADEYFEDTFFPSDGVFKAGNTPAARLEIEYGRTTYVDVPVTRTNSFEVAMSNRVVATFGADYREERWATWAKGDETVYVRIPAPGGIQVGDEVALWLFSANDMPLDTSAVTCVTEPENNPKNPRWIGLKTASALGWGEWTMDYDVAKAKVAAAEGEAYTLVLVGGSTWCPDCVKVDHYLIDTPEFRTWSAEHHVACVAIDVPKMNATEPSLLTYGTCAVSKRYITCTTPNQEPYQSGAGYLSRNMIAPAEAASVAARNHAFLYNDTKHGGLCRPENMDDNEETGGFKTGIPCLILMRKDGSVAGRIYQFNNVSPAHFEPGYIVRLNELLGQVEDLAEEDNDHYSTTEVVLKPGVGASATISATDARDVWRLAACDGRARIALSGEGPASNVTLRISQLVDGELVDLGVAAGKLESGLAVEGVFTGSNVYVTVEAGKSFSTDPKNYLPTTEDSLVRGYVLKLEVTVIPSEVTACHVFDALVKTAAVEVVSGTSYWIEGLGALSGSEGLVREGENVYRATTSGLVEVPLADPAEGVRTLVCRTWTGGEIGFEETERTVWESKAGAVDVAIGRSSGESGYVTASVTLRRDAAVQKALDDGRIVWSDTDIRWENGQSSMTNLPLVVNDDILHDGDLELVFDLSVMLSEIAGVVVRKGYEVFTVNILEDDPEAPGVLAIAESAPAFATARTIKAEAGSELSVGVLREAGATGAVSAYLILLDGDMELSRSETLTWQDRSRENMQRACVDVPADRVGQCLTIKLVSTGAAAVDADRACMTLQVLSAQGPAFDQSTVAISAVHRFELRENINVSRTGGFDSVGVKKASGSLPPGVRVAYGKACTLCEEGAALLVSGVPSAVGTFTATYQLYGKKGGATVLGSTVQLKFSITDMTAQLKAEMPSLKSTRTYKNIPISDGEHLTGLLTVTVPATGRVSARYKTPNKTWAYSAAGWSDYAEGAYVSATLYCTQEDRSEAMDLFVYPDGGAEIAFGDPETGDSVSAVLPDFAWSALSPASPWQGQYTVQMPQTNVVLASELAHAAGDAFLALRMTASAAKRGTMQYSGLMPNGLKVSGSATLVPQADGRVRLPFMNASKAAQTAYALTGAVDIRPNAAEEHTSYRWSVKAAKGAVPRWARADALGGSAEFAVFGGYYDKDEIWDCFVKDYGILGGFEPFGFTANREGAFEVSPKYGSVGDFAFADAFVTEENVPYLKADAENPDGVKLAFKAGTGVLSGTLNVPFEGGVRVKAQWRGVVLPGWGNCASCEQPGSVAERPFMSGSCWFADHAGKRTFRNGCVVTLDRPAEDIVK